MPELPDLIYIEKKLSNFLPGKTVVATKVTEPIVIRNNLGRKFEDAFTGCSFTELFRRGPFLGFRFDAPLEIIIHPMLAGRFYIESPQIEKSSRPPGAKDLCFRMELSDSGVFAYYDDKKMGKVYLIEKGNYSSIAKFENQGPYILGEEFSYDVFQKIVSSRRQQVRAFLLDQTNISSVGNAYGDEILFAAGIHPKTFCHQLSQEEKQKLFDSILSVMREGIEAVETAAKSVDIKVRDHMKVRNRKGEDCPRCGAKIRRENVLGYDAFFCPTCQPPKRDLFIDWKK